MAALVMAIPEGLAVHSNNSEITQQWLAEMYR